MPLFTEFIINDRPYEEDEREPESELDGFDIIDEEESALDWDLDKDLEAIDREKDF